LAPQISGYVLLNHDATPIKTRTNEFFINERDKLGRLGRIQELTLEPRSESVRLLQKYATTKTIPIYMNTGSKSNHRVSLTGTPFDVSEHASNMELLSRIFREVRRMTTLMYLLWDKESGEELKTAKERVSPRESFLKLLNAGRDNNGFVFNPTRTGYDANKSSRTDADNDEPFTFEKAQTICGALNVIPSFNYDKNLTPEKKNEHRVDRTVFRVPKLWSNGMETAEDTGRVIAQYAHGSAHEVGARVAGGYLFRRETMFDRKVFDQWNLLYEYFDINEYDARAQDVVQDLRNYLVATWIQESTAEVDEDEPPPPQEEGAQEMDVEATAKFNSLEGWWDELRDTSLPDDGSFEERVERQRQALSGDTSMEDVAEAVAEDVENYEALTKQSRRHWDVNEGRVSPSVMPIYQAVRKFRLWRRVKVLNRNRHLVETAETAEPPSATDTLKDTLNYEWFTDTFGTSPNGYDERSVRCGEKSSVILTTKEEPVGKYAIDDKGTGKVWGVMFVNELMRYEFGAEGYTPEKSVMKKVESVYSGSSVDVDRNGIDTAKEQFKTVASHLDSMWNLLAKMSAVGILNVDAHLGNYMITDYGTTKGTTKMFAKAIDFDPSYTTVFTTKELIGDDAANPNPEGWKPLYVLNVLMVLYTLSQDISREKLYSLLKNANRIDANDTVFRDGSLYALKSGREDQFKGIVAETIRALESTPYVKMSVPQKLLAASWLGGFKGMGNLDDLRLPTAFFSNGDIRGALINIAEAMNNDRTPKYTKAYVVSKSETASVEPLSEADVGKAIDILIRLDNATESSNRQAPKVPSPGATHLTQMEWAMRHNLFARSFMDPAEFLCQQWAKRQELVYFTIDRTGLYDLSNPFPQITQTIMIKILDAMTPNSTRAFHSINSFFDNDYRRVFAPAMHHCTQIRESKYRVIDLLYDYVFESPTFGKSIGDGKSHKDLLPRTPDFVTKLEVERPRWQTLAGRTAPLDHQPRTLQWQRGRHCSPCPRSCSRLLP